MNGLDFLVLRSRVAKPALTSGTLDDTSTVYRGGWFSGVGLRSWPFFFGLREMLDSNIFGGVFLCAGLVSLLLSKAVSTLRGH